MKHGIWPPGGGLGVCLSTSRLCRSAVHTVNSSDQGRRLGSSSLSLHGGTAGDFIKGFTGTAGGWHRRELTPELVSKYQALQLCGLRRGCWTLTWPPATTKDQGHVPIKLYLQAQVQGCSSLTCFPCLSHLCHTKVSWAIVPGYPLSPASVGTPRAPCWSQISSRKGLTSSHPARRY